MFAKRKVNRNVRQKRNLSSSDDEREEGKEKQTEKITLESIKKKPKSILTASTHKQKNADDVNTMVVTFDASGTASSLVQDTATRTLDIDGVERDEQEKDALLPDDSEEVYRGIEGYKEYVNKKTSNINQISASRIRAGPLKGVTNVRISCRFDYQPDVCKDYKETGYCGYGDSCKFMHDRGDYKSGWELDREWEKQQAAGGTNRVEDNDEEKWLIRSDDEKEGDENHDQASDSDEDDDVLPFACYICRGDFKSPVVTRCGHYFCESCAIKQNAKSPKCYACGLATNGIFNVAKDLLAKMEERNKRREEKERKIREEIGEPDFDAEVSTDDEQG